jgi:hypothetical protein
MLTIRNVILAGALACSIGVAHATPATWVDNIDFNPDKYIASKTSFSYTHDIRDDGFQPLQDIVYGYSLSVDLFDKPESAGVKGVALIDVPGITGDRVYFDLSGQEFGGWSLAGYAQIALTGLYDVTIRSLSGDFFLGSSTLVVRGDDRHSVPEPGATALLLLGLLGAAWAWRSRLSKTMLPQSGGSSPA